jgi:hypothetical protein
MPIRILSLFFALWTLAIAAQTAAAQGPAKQLDFNRDVKPILSNKCFQCHGPDENERKGGTDGLRLDTVEGATEDLGGHAAIVPGAPEKSELVRRINSADRDEAMPPKESGKKLSARDREVLAQWIREGAKYAGHWSYVKAVRPPLPKVKDAAWPKNEIDHFLLARLEAEGLKPSPEADRYTLIRRASLDLTGLPPTLAEVEAFVNDKDPKAYEHLIDRLLAKDAYGEHWAHMWLDLARYADSAGYADDPPRKIWLYRDYVIRALNANKPFDQFTIEQIAGDLLPNATDEQLLATAFHRNTLTNNEGGTNDEEFRNVAVVDRVNTTMAVWMGTTMACAQCHSHKYDPISQEEYFRFFAFFNNTADADRGDESPILSISTPEQQKQRSQYEMEIARLEKMLKTPTAELKAAQAKWETAFPLNLTWNGLKPVSAKSQTGSAATIVEEGAIKIAAGAKTDTYTLEIPLAVSPLRALRLEALPDDSLPGKGPGHGGGNFVITHIAATLTPPQSATLAGRFIRVEIPGKNKILSLAEVQAFAGSENVATKGEAKQSSTDYEGPAKLAIDGNTDGRYVEAKSTTHTAASDDPWWEVDLKGEQKLDRLVIWNRTDNNVGDRLANFRVSLLSEKREPVWTKDVAAPPKPSTELSLSGKREVEFSAALADYSQAMFDPESVLKNADPKSKGWAVGGALGQPHSLTLIAKGPVEAPAGSTLTVTIEQNSKFENHVLGHFRLAATDSAGVAEWSRTPKAVLEVLRVPAAKRSETQQETIAQHYLSLAPELETTRKELAAVKKQLADLKPDTAPIMKELAAGQRRVTKIQHRGNFLDVGKEVTEGTPAVFPPLPDGANKDRLAMAKWLVDENNPLTPRVIANRHWEQIFGIGIVATSEEFGSQGEQPFHPELLDWLATEIIRLKWDIKAFHKLLVTSAAYRQSSRVTPDLVQRDPDNRLLARGPRFRFSAETIRDQALFVSGLLSPKLYGPPVKPHQPSLGISAAFGGGIDWQTSMGDDKYRRGLYTTWRRSNPYPSMATFDAPNREVCTVRRVRTNTPLQALVTLNDPVYIEAAQALARRIVSSGGATPAERQSYGFRLCLSRPPSDAESARLVKLYEQALARLSENADEAQKLATEPLGPAPKEMNVSELAAWTVVANVLLNLDETVMKR